METRDLYQQFNFSAATPYQVYDCYINRRKHADFTGSDVEIDARPGGSFSIYNGYATGKYLQLEPGKLIIQTWRADEDGWPAGYYSEITIMLESNPQGGTLMKFVQKGVPAAEFDDVSAGWYEYYWEPMEEYLQGF